MDSCQAVIDLYRSAHPILNIRKYKYICKIPNCVRQNVVLCVGSNKENHLCYPHNQELAEPHTNIKGRIFYNKEQARKEAQRLESVQKIKSKLFN